MNRIFGFSRNAVALVGLAVAIILVVLVGVIVLGSAAIQGLMVGGAKVQGIPLLALLLTIIVLLSAVFIILLVLFWCCCRHRGTPGKESNLPPNVFAAFLPMLPLMQQLPKVLSDLGLALYATGKTLAWVEGKISVAADGFSTVSTAAANAPRLALPQLDPNPDGSDTFFIPPFFSKDWKNPVDGIVSSLRTASTNLSTTGALPVPLVSGSLNLGQVNDSLVNAGIALARIAKALDHTLVQPAELT